MKLVTMILTAMALVACHVEGPGEGEAKAEVVEKEDLWSGAVFWGKPDKDLPDQLFGVLMDFRKKKAVIQAVDWDENKKEYVPVEYGQGDCVDRFAKMKAVYTTGGDFQRHQGRKGKKYLEIEMEKAVYTTGGVFQLGDVTYGIPNSDGDIVEYTSQPERELPSGPHNVRHSEIVPLLEDGRDCDHVSKSDNDNGN